MNAFNTGRTVDHGLSEADAALICRAVNSHQELVDALQTLLNVSDCTCARIEWDDGRCAHDMARAALAKASPEGGGE